MSDGKTDFAIIDALLWEPGTGFFLLDYHLRRIERSAAHFHFPLAATEPQSRLLDYARRLGHEPRKVRLTLSREGTIFIADESVKLSTALKVALAKEPVDSHDEFLQHKTSRREVYVRALKSHPEAQDVLLWNERRELTETCHGNIVLKIDGRMLTPPLSSGLLPGVFRAWLLDQGKIQERVLPVDAVQLASKVLMINSVRKWCEVKIDLF